MSSLKLSLLLFLAVSVSSCTQFSPFEDRRREPGSPQIYVGSSKPTHPAICYNPLFYTEAELQPMADEICQKNNPETTAKLRKHDNFSCRLFVPSKAYYECIKKE